MSLRHTLATLLLALAMPAAWANGDRTETLTVDGVARHYLVHVPPAATHRPLPLLVVLHGGGSRAESMSRFTGLDTLADRVGVIVVYPQGLDRHWNDGRATIKRKVDDVGFIRALLDRIEHEQPVDPHRVGVAGISNGAIFAERLGCDLADRITLVAAIAGSLAEDYRVDCRPTRPVSVLQFDGTSDPIVPYTGGSVADFGGHGEGGRVLSVDATAAFWAANDRCPSPDAPEALPPRASLDPTRVFLQRWRDCRDGTDVAVYRIQQGGHTWPGGPQYLPRFIVGRASRQIDASAILVDDLVDHPRPDGAR